jgi:hypothetical protein
MKSASQRKDSSFIERLFAGSGEMRARMKALDWSATPVGSPEKWPQSLLMAVSICLHSRFPIVIIWGLGAAEHDVL